MRDGKVEQLATPRELYARPASAFVAGFIGVSNLITFRIDRREGEMLAMELGEGERLLAVDPGVADPDVQITVRPEWIKLALDGAGDRESLVTGTVTDVVYLGSVTQLLVLLRTGERLTVHRLNDQIDVADPRPGERVALRWAAEHSYVIGEPAAAETREAPAATAG
jgi:spermidine/putrescine transport system ATP-binding protein